MVRQRSEALHRRRIPLGESKLAANRILAWEELRRQPLVDDDRLGTGCTVSLAKSAAADDRHAAITSKNSRPDRHRRRQTAAALMFAPKLSTSSSRSPPSSGGTPVVTATASTPGIVRSRGSSRSKNARRVSATRVLRLRQLQPHRHQTVDVDAEVEGIERHEAADHQARTCQQHDGEGKLRDDHGAAEPAHATACRCSAPAFLQMRRSYCPARRAVPARDRTARRSACRSLRHSRPRRGPP